MSELKDLLANHGSFLVRANRNPVSGQNLGLVARHLHKNQVSSPCAPALLQQASGVPHSFEILTGYQAR